MANPAAHDHFTAPEEHRQRLDVKAIVVAASTGGTFPGTGRDFRASCTCYLSTHPEDPAACLHPSL